VPHTILSLIISSFKATVEYLQSQCSNFNLVANWLLSHHYVAFFYQRDILRVQYWIMELNDLGFCRTMHKFCFFFFSNCESAEQFPSLFYHSKIQESTLFLHVFPFRGQSNKKVLCVLTCDCASFRLFFLHTGKVRLSS
jgi:hypothetical protein